MLQVIQERRHKYICPVCGFTQDAVVVDDKGNSLGATKEQEDWGKEQTGYIKAPPLHNRFIPGGLMGNHLLASSLCDKYVSGLSCYRQSYRYQNFGATISRQNLSSWFLKIGKAFIPIAEEIRKEIIKFEACQCDETRFKVMEEKEHDDKNNSWVWVLSSPNPEKRAVYYRYDPFRSSEVLEQMIGNYSGYLMSDKHSAYKTQSRDFKFISCFCLVHARREFAKLIESDAYKEGTEGYTTIKFAIETMGRVFAADSRNRSQYMDISKPDIPGFLKHRRAEVEPALRELTHYFIERLEVHENDDNLTGAMNYYLNDVKEFSNYLDSPWLDCSNNQSERLVKKLFYVRINSLFAGSPDGARALAAIETVLQTAMLNGINIENYATYLLDELTVLNYQKDKQLDYAKFLPWNFNEEVTAQVKTKMITEVNMHVSHRKKR
jgi:transposase